MREGDARQLVSDLFHERTSPSDGAMDRHGGTGSDNGPWPLNHEEILLMDEVDVFFTTNYYGNTLNQVKRVPLPAVEQALNLVVQIWDDNLEDVTMIHRAYDKLCKDEDLMDQFLADLGNESGSLRELQKRVVLGEIQRMVSSYIAFVREGKELGVSEKDQKDKRYFWSSRRGVGYKLDDGVSYDVTKGYQTCFAYVLEKKRGKLCHVQDEDGITMNFTQLFQRRLGLLLPCGLFAYDTLRLDNASPYQPACILGVSGTLTSLASHELKILLECGIARFSVMPSVYGEQKRKVPGQGEECVMSTTFPYMLTTNDVNKMFRIWLLSCVRRSLVPLKSRGELFWCFSGT